MKVGGEEASLLLEGGVQLLLAGSYRSVFAPMRTHSYWHPEAATAALHRRMRRGVTTLIGFAIYCPQGSAGLQWRFIKITNCLMQPHSAVSRPLCEFCSITRTPECVTEQFFLLINNTKELLLFSFALPALRLVPRKQLPAKVCHWTPNLSGTEGQSGEVGTTLTGRGGAGGLLAYLHLSHLWPS